MKTIFNILILLFFQSNYYLFAQKIGFEEIDNSKVSPWFAKSIIEYEAVYHFGDSEMESDFVLIINQNKICAQIKSGLWGEEGKSWLWDYENLTSVSIKGNKLYSNKTNGEFVLYDNGKEKIKGLKVNNSWSGITEQGEYEIGTKSYSAIKYFSGKYPQASKEILNKEELKKISKLDLKIMRNEIFARYGYKFKSGGLMDIYFKKQKWYTKQHKDVSKYLTSIEKRNINLLKQIENE